MSELTIAVVCRSIGALEKMPPFSVAPTSLALNAKNSSTLTVIEGSLFFFGDDVDDDEVPSSPPPSEIPPSIASSSSGLYDAQWVLL